VKKVLFSWNSAMLILDDLCFHNLDVRSSDGDSVCPTISNISTPAGIAFWRFAQTKVAKAGAIINTVAP
jgi:hypothetical protein